MVVPAAPPRKITKFEGTGSIRTWAVGDRRDRKVTDHADEKHSAPIGTLANIATTPPARIPNPRRDTESNQQDGRGIVAPSPKYRGVPERELLRIAAHEVPRHADEGEEQDPNENVDRKRAVVTTSGSASETSTSAANPNPPGVSRRVLSRCSPQKDSLGPNGEGQEQQSRTPLAARVGADELNAQRLGTPIMRPAISAPWTFPSVPNTTATNAMSTNTCPSGQYTG